MAKAKNVKAVFVKGKNKVIVDDIPAPSIADGDILVKMKACGLCGSDLEKSVRTLWHGITKAGS